MQQLARFARGVDVVTFDWENVPVASARAIAAHPAGVAAAARPRSRAGPPVREAAVSRASAFRLRRTRAVDSTADLERAVATLGAPGILKTRRLGYDGKGQVRIRRAGDAARGLRHASPGQPLVYERFVNFSREVSLIARARPRRRRGRTTRSPRTCTSTASSRSRARPGSDARLQRLAERNHRRLMRALGYVGVLCVEYFVERGRLVANEMAPRVHNSGHWTIEGAETSQFENHVRAVAGLPLGSAAPARPRRRWST